MIIDPEQPVWLSGTASHSYYLRNEKILGSIPRMGTYFLLIHVQSFFIFIFHLPCQCMYVNCDYVKLLEGAMGAPYLSFLRYQDVSKLPCLRTSGTATPTDTTYLFHLQHAFISSGIHPSQASSALSPTDICTDNTQLHFVLPALAFERRVHNSRQDRIHQTEILFTPDQSAFHPTVFLISTIASPLLR